jgi:transposase
MRRKSHATDLSSEEVVKDIRRETRKRYSAEEKIRIVLDGLRGEYSPTLCPLSKPRRLEQRSHYSPMHS